MTNQPVFTRTASPEGPEVPVMGLGCMGMSEFYGPSDRKQSISTIHHALEQGMRLLDTADMYGSGENEKLVGEAIKDRRDQAFLCTKFAVQRGEGGSFTGVCGRPEYVKQACTDSLKRLGVDYIDLYYQHRVDPSVPIEDTIGAMSELVKEGKVRYLGMSEAAPDIIRRAHKVAKISALQTELSLWSRDPEEELLDVCKSLGILFVAYSPLGRGFLTGQIKSVNDFAPDDYRRNTPRFQGENFKKNLQLVEKVESLAQKLKCTPAQLALAWVVQRGDHVITIPGTRSSKRVDENIAALKVKLSPEDLKAIDEIAPIGVAAGERYPS